MSFRYFSVMPVILVLLCGSSTLWAQDKLPNDLISTTASLTGAQQRKVDEYANYWINKMQSSADPLVSDARDEIVSPMNHPSAGPVFKSAYSATLARLLPELLKSDRMLVRFNAMLCVSAVIDTSAIRMIQEGLVDTNPAIRYLAAQASGSMGENLQPADQVRILSLLNSSFMREADQVVVEQILGSMSLLTIPMARESLLGALNLHVNVHHGNTNLTLKADRNAMLAMLTTLVREQSDGKKIKIQTSKQYSIAACRFMIHCATALDQGRVHESMAPQYKSMITDCDKILRWVCTRLMELETTKLPQDDMRPNLNAKNWLPVLLRAQEWASLLQDPPFNCSKASLAVPSQ